MGCTGDTPSIRLQTLSAHSRFAGVEPGVIGGEFLCVVSSVSIGQVSSLVKVEEEDSVPVSNHTSSFEAALAQIEAFALAMP